MEDKLSDDKKEKCLMPFKTLNNNEYIYDSVTGTVFPSDEIINDCIDLYAQYDRKNVSEKLLEKYSDTRKIKAAVAFVDKMILNKNAFYKKEFTALEESKFGQDFSEEDIETCLFKFGMMEQLILNVTENCNLRCKYCYFSESYENTRNRTNKIMPEEIAYKSLDFFFDKMKEIHKINPGKICAITFYGGEPLLNFELIRKCTIYIKENCPIKYMLNLTTNGLLLSGAKAEFLHDNNFHISVSLDGNKENHDRNRVMENGEGSFDIVYKNIKDFQEKYPDYKNINIVSVYDYATKIADNDNFFCEAKLPRIVFVNQVTERGTNYYDRFTSQDVSNFILEYKNALENYLNIKEKGNASVKYSEIMFELSAMLPLIKLGCDDVKNPILPYTSSCVPGMKISVSTDGGFYICEKMDCPKPIGSYKDGLDYGAIKALIKEYNYSVTKDCKFCPLYRVCPACFCTTSTRDGFEQPNCEGLKEFFKSQLSIVYTVLENNPHAFDYFSGKIEWLLNK